MGSSRRAEGIPAFTRDVLGCFRSGVTPGVETLALRTSRRLATQRDEIRNDIFTNFWDPELQSFVQAKGTKDLDASAMLMPMMRFISPVDPMWLSSLRAIEKHLIEDTLVRRYDVERNHVDGLPGTEGSFIACSFWYVECLARAGKLERAQLLFEKLLSYSNHL